MTAFGNVAVCRMKIFSQYRGVARWAYTDCRFEVNRKFLPKTL
jgi:hypothetical protein